MVTFHSSRKVKKIRGEKIAKREPMRWQKHVSLWRIEKIINLWDVDVATADNRWSIEWSEGGSQE